MAAICVAALLTSPHAVAHPHVWVTVACDLILDGERNIVGIAERWTFDEMFSSFAVNGLDRNRDGAYSRDELRELSATIARSASPQKFFTYVERDGASVGLKEAPDAWSEFKKDGALTFHIRIDFAEPVRLGPVPLRIEIYDRDLYADFRFAEADGVRFTPDAMGCAARVDKPEADGPGGFQSLEDALINGPITRLTNAILVTC